MPDDPIIEYLRTRANVTQPPDLVGSVVDAVERTPQQRHSWFAPFIPAAAAVGVAGAVLIAALVVGQNPRFGPTPSTGPVVDPTAAPTPAATEEPDADGSLQPGDSLIIDAVEQGGTWGTITVERGDDVGGYPNASVSEDAFVVEVFVSYDAERLPDPETFGRDDWSLATTDGTAVGDLLELAPGTDPERPPLGTLPGAIDIFTTPTNGWLLFEVPRDAADKNLRLIYQPTDFDEQVTVIPVRDPGDPPDWIPSATPAPSPDEAGYVDREGLPFSVLDSAEADALFETPDTCTNPEGGYTVTFPDDWYTNTAIGDTPACSWFSPVFYEVTDLDEVPAEIAITVMAFEGEYGFLYVDLYSEDVEVDGVSGRRFEHGYTKEVDAATDQYQYNYLVRLGAEAKGPRVWAITGTYLPGDYALNKAVLDRIMASLEFDTSP